MQATETRNRRFPFVEVLLLAIVGVLVGAGFLTIWVPYRDQQLALAEIKKAGGRVTTTQNAPSWLEWGGFKFFDEPTYIDLSKIAVDDELLAHVGTLTPLKEISLNGAHISDVGLKHLSNLKNLNALDFRNTRVSELGMKHISELRDLDTLLFEHSEIADNAFEVLHDFPSLEELYLRDTPVNTAAFEQLRKLTQITYLLINDTDLPSEYFVKLRSELPGAQIVGGSREPLPETSGDVSVDAAESMPNEKNGESKTSVP